MFKLLKAKLSSLCAQTKSRLLVVTVLSIEIEKLETNLRTSKVMEISFYSCEVSFQLSCIMCVFMLQSLTYQDELIFL